MKAVLDMADAVAAELNAADEGTFSQAFTATRRVLPRVKLEDLGSLHVTVAPKAADISRASRSDSQVELKVDIGVQKKLGRDLDAELPPLSALVEEIADFLSDRSPSDAPWATWAGVENDPVYDPGHLAEERVFTSVLTVTYRAMK